MLRLSLHLDSEEVWKDVKLENGDWNFHRLLGRADNLEIALGLDRMESGASSVMLRFDLPGGGSVIGETSLKLLEQAVRACRAREQFKREEQSKAQV